MTDEKAEDAQAVHIFKRRRAERHGGATLFRCAFMNVGAGQIIFVVLLVAALLAAFVMYFRIKALNRRLEAAVADRTRELEEQTQAAISAARAKSDFLAKMSHEIRTPMNTITGLTELILRKGISSETLDCVADIRQAGVNLLGIINDILDFSEIESDRKSVV